jgi:hypothetical protein
MCALAGGTQVGIVYTENKSKCNLAVSNMNTTKDVIPSLLYILIVSAALTSVTKGFLRGRFTNKKVSRYLNSEKTERQE